MATTTFAVLPTSSEPSWSATPQISRGIDGDRLERLVVGQTEGHGVSSRIGQVAGVVRVVGGERDLHAALVQFRRQAVDRVVALVLFRMFIDRANDHGHLQAAT